MFVWRQTAVMCLSWCTKDEQLLKGYYFLWNVRAVVKPTSRKTRKMLLCSWKHLTIDHRNILRFGTSITRITFEIVNVLWKPTFGWVHIVKCTVDNIKSSKNWSLTELPMQFANVFTICKSSCGEVMFLHLSVILSQGGSVCGSGTCMAGRDMCGRRGMPGRGHAWQERWPLQWTVHILLECNQVRLLFWEVNGSCTQQWLPGVCVCQGGCLPRGVSAQRGVCPEGCLPRGVSAQRDVFSGWGVTFKL